MFLSLFCMPALSQRIGTKNSISRCLMSFSPLAALTIKNKLQQGDAGGMGPRVGASAIGQRIASLGVGSIGYACMCAGGQRGTYVKPVCLSASISPLKRLGVPSPCVYSVTDVLGASGVYQCYPGTMLATLASRRTSLHSQYGRGPSCGAALGPSYVWMGVHGLGRVSGTHGRSSPCRVWSGDGHGHLHVCCPGSPHACCGLVHWTGSRRRWT